MTLIRSTCYSISLLLSSVAIDVHAVDSLTEAIKDGELGLNFRLRYEDVDQSGVESVDLTSLKTRLTYETASYKGWRGLIEFDDVTHVGDFDGGITDPEGTEVNQAAVSYSWNKTSVKYGRQRILLDNQRFVGGVGFRQNEQTYDSLSLTHSGWKDTKIFLSHIHNVNRIFGEDNPAGDHENDSYLFNLHYSGLSFGKFSAYAYLLDNEDAVGFSTDTYGLRFSGKREWLGYTLEYARQSDAADNSANYTADYGLVELIYQPKGWKGVFGYELLGADGSDGQFITPLATLHKFQGWADQFLGGGTGNIPGGIEDVYVSISTQLSGVKLVAVYHQFESDDSAASGMGDLGSEWGISVAKAVGPVGLSLKYADYSADDFASDIDKLWLTAEVKF